MARLRRDTQVSLPAPNHRPLRVVASGTLFVTHNLTLPSFPEPSAVIRAHSVAHTRGGSAATCLSILAQFPAVEAMLVAPLGGNEEGQMIIRDLEQEKVTTRFCKIWEHAGVPSAWILHADDTDSRTVINNNPLPDITHEEFVSLLGPILVPENYAYLASNPSSSPPHTPNPNSAGLLANSNTPQPRTSISTPSPVNNSPAPLDWIHFEGRSVKTTLSNMIGLDSLAREKKWRSHCVFSVDVGRRARQGIEALIPHADVIFLNKHYARAHSPHYASSPRAFLLSLTPVAPPHALLVAHWGAEGAAVLSVPTKEYFQSSGWVDNTPLSASAETSAAPQESEAQSVRSGSVFWAGGAHTESSSDFTTGGSASVLEPQTRTRGPTAHNSRRHRRQGSSEDEDESSDSEGTQIAGRRGGAANGHGNGAQGGGQSPGQKPGVVDEVGGQDAFVAGMMFALSRRMLPGDPYTPFAVRKDGTAARSVDLDRERWRLEECLRFATELAGRKARRAGWAGLAEEMAAAGWFEN